LLFFFVLGSFLFFGFFLEPMKTLYLFLGSLSHGENLKKQLTDNPKLGPSIYVLLFAFGPTSWIKSRGRVGA